jgi:hypothetical protein
MSVNKPKTTPWNRIKAEYLDGVTPKELAIKYDITAKSISNKANKEKWTSKKAKINENLGDRVQKELEEITTLGIKRLKELLNSKEIKPNELISAIRLGFETTLLNKNKEKKEDDLLPPNITIQF